jgi:hypothetical protein
MLGLGGAGGSPDLSQCSRSTPPAEAQPIPPQASVVDSCRIAADLATGWAFPTGGINIDERGLIVGRWTVCGSFGSGVAPHAGIELGGNGRFRTLTTDATGALVPLDVSSGGDQGYYYLLGNGQLNLTTEGPGGTTSTFRATFAPGMDALRFLNEDGTSSRYARSAPSATNGDENVPSVSDGACSMAGTWAVPGNTPTPTVPPAWLTFDSQGNFAGGPLGADGCPDGTIYGTYRLTPGLFQLTSNVGMGSCAWWFTASYPARFDQGCSRLTTMQLYDNCTGGRGYLNGVVTMTRVP